MLNNNNMISENVSEAVAKISTDEKIIINALLCVLVYIATAYIITV